jgi:hypothetical protein
MQETDMEQQDPTTQIETDEPAFVNGDVPTITPETYTPTIEVEASLVAIEATDGHPATGPIITLTAICIVGAVAVACLLRYMRNNDAAELPVIEEDETGTVRAPEGHAFVQDGEAVVNEEEGTVEIPVKVVEVETKND